MYFFAIFHPFQLLFVSGSEKHYIDTNNNSPQIVQ